VHRDIKPENILLARGHARVADFGVAHAIELAGAERLTQTGLAVGTPAYMSPEQATGDRVDARSDVYALACVLYEMLGGEPPTRPSPRRRCSRSGSASRSRISALSAACRPPWKRQSPGDLPAARRIASPAPGSSPTRSTPVGRLLRPRLVRGIRTAGGDCERGR
jgi:serine/threonine protein kinase